MTTIVNAKTVLDFKVIEQLADTIWRQHYTPIIGISQVEYMLDKYQTAETIASQIEAGSNYFTLNYQNNPVGYISIKKDEDILFLSKIYVLSNYRGKKIGKTAMTFIENYARKYNLKSIILNVDKNNTNSILAYEKMGFKKIEAVVNDIGNGFVMDDYRMMKAL